MSITTFLTQRIAIILAVVVLSTPAFACSENLIYSSDIAEIGSKAVAYQIHDNASCNDEQVSSNDEAMYQLEEPINLLADMKSTVTSL